MNATEVRVRFDVFLRCATADRIEKALRAAGLRVFRGDPFDDFDKCAPALAASRVLLAEQAPLTGAARGLAIVPGEPLPDLVRRVRGRLGEPLGSRCLWTVHSELVARRAVLVRGLPGIGKTTLAEQYAGLFGGFGGRVLRTGPFGGLDPDDFLPQFHLALAAAAGTTGLGPGRLRALLAAGGPVLLLVDDVPPGLPPGVLDRVPPAGPVRTLLTGRSARWNAATVDVPGLSLTEALRRFPALGPPSDAAVRRFVARCEGHPMTLRATASTRRNGPGLDAAPDTAPHAIRDVLRSLGPLSRELLRLGSVLAPAPIPLPVAAAALGSPGTAEFEAAVEELAGHGFATHEGDDVRLQALAVEVAAGEFGEPAAGPAAAVLRELAGQGFARHTDDLRPQTPAAGESGKPTAGPAEAALREPAGHLSTKQADHPQPQTPAAEKPGKPTAGPATEATPREPAGHVSTKQADHPQPQTPAAEKPGKPTAGNHSRPRTHATEEPDPAAEAVLREPDGNHSRGTHLLQHARVLADRLPAHRVALLRPLAAAHEAHGDPGAAGEVHAAILSTGEATTADYTAAARVELVCGLDPEAVEHARAALALATDAPELRAAGLVAARALDAHGDYAEADRTFWAAHRPATAEECRFAATARRLRGRPREAIVVLEPALADLPPGPARDELNVEYARNLLQAGQPARARDVAAEAAGTEAELVHAEAVVALDLADRAPAELVRAYTARYGIENALTLTASVHAHRAALGRPDHALTALARTERVVRRVLGDDHALYYRLRHVMGLAHARLRDFDGQADVLDGIRGPQVRLLGRTHPETLETRLDLGLALALSGRGPRERATALVDEAARDAVRVSPALAAKARAAQQVVRLPLPFVSALHTLERLVWPGG